MVIGTSHISISTSDIDLDIQKYQEMGFHLKFLNKQIDNHPQKKRFLENYTPKHSIAVLSGKTGIDMELVEHHKIENDKINQGININFDQDSVHSIEYKLQEFESSVLFWEQQMGFEIIKSEDANCYLEKKSVFPQWNCKLKLNKSEYVQQKPKLDAVGVTSLAFLSTSLEKDIANIKQKYSLFCTEIFELIVNNQKLRISIVEGPSYEIIELIELKNE
jgi:hypothetical protein